MGPRAGIDGVVRAVVPVDSAPFTADVVGAGTTRDSTERAGWLGAALLDFADMSGALLGDPVFEVFCHDRLLHFGQRSGLSALVETVHECPHFWQFHCPSMAHSTFLDSPLSI